MAEDIRNTENRSGPQTGSGSGAAYKTGYASGGLGQGEDRARHGGDAAAPDSWDAPGVTPDGDRTGSSQDGHRVAHDGEGEDDPEQWAGKQEPNDG